MRTDLSILQENDLGFEYFIDNSTRIYIFVILSKREIRRRIFMQIENALSKYAQTLVEVGINLQKGDRVIVNSDTDALPLLREVVKICWEMGAIDVITKISDKQIELAYYLYGHDEVFEDLPDFKVDYAESLMQEKYHRMSLFTPSLDLFKDVDGEKMHKSNVATSEKMKHIMKYMDKGDIKWVVAAAASPVWAKKVYPDLGEEEGVAKLWELLFQACRIDTENPVAEWQAHDQKLKHLEAWLDEQQFEYLHYEGPGTDLTVYLAEEHKWIGGSSITPDGIKYVANIPTEEIFTAPYKTKVDGTLRVTKPLSLSGKILEDMSFVFSEGKVVEFKASSNQEVLEKHMEMDEGARYLGEVALVAHSSPISQMGVVFGNTLFDENASCHFALGSSYAETIQGGEKLSEEERLTKGANQSMIHIDFMIGSGELQVTGYKPDGRAVPVLIDGEFPEL